MKKWMMFAGALLVAVAGVAFHDQHVGARERQSVIDSQVVWDQTYQQGLKKVEEFKLEMEEKAAAEKRLAAEKEESRRHLASMREILSPAEFRDYEKTLAADESRRLQEAQLKELREIKEKLGK